MGTKRFFDDAFFHVNEGRNPRQAKGHLFALRAIHPQLQGLLLLDGDNRGLPDHEIIADGLSIKRWSRYEIENYLLIPEAIRRTLSPPGKEYMFTAEEANRAIEFLKTELPPAFFKHPLQDNAAVVSVPASKKLLPQMFEAAGRPMEKSDFFLIASNMIPGEIHPEVIEVLDMIAGLLPLDETNETA